MDITQTLNDTLAAAQTEDLPEVMADLKVTPEVAGQIIMELVGNPDRLMTLEERLFWAQVENYIGLDYLGKLRHVTAYMAKIRTF